MLKRKKKCEVQLPKDMGSVNDMCYIRTYRYQNSISIYIKCVKHFVHFVAFGNDLRSSIQGYV